MLQGNGLGLQVDVLYLIIYKYFNNEAPMSTRLLAKTRHSEAFLKVAAFMRQKKISPK